MAATLSCHYCPSLSLSSKLINPCIIFPDYVRFSNSQKTPSFHRLRPRSSSQIHPRFPIHNDQEDRVFPLKECAISIALAIGLITGVPALDWCNYANAATPAVLPELSGLISGTPIQDPVEEDMVDGFPYKVPEEYQHMPLLKGRATVNMKVKVKDTPNLDECVFCIVLDAYNALVTAGNFVDLVERHFYDGMEIRRADGFVVQTGDPEGPAEDFIDPSTGKTCTIPSEIMALDLYKAQTRLPFNVFGTMAMARDESENNFASSQVFWLLKESELTPSNANVLDGREAVFGYVTENEDFLADVKVVDVIFK
ncbi:hypothetical protein LOK49_LG04G03763 [Camellia lanceoleosa]|uniref:Uncharacterized protein n=1 Tax=Camellia lanceoleosa TaxID=1840588 RepID=A0ACC0HU58_9ERIC|nr:hypothetical protein LOK49_LG04G03763 [Camellia lanceoleosa]